MLFHLNWKWSIRPVYEFVLKYNPLLRECFLMSLNLPLTSVKYFLELPISVIALSFDLRIISLSDLQEAIKRYYNYVWLKVWLITIMIIQTDISRRNKKKTDDRLWITNKNKTRENISVLQTIVHMRKKIGLNNL